MSEAFNTPTASCPGCGGTIAFRVGSSRVLVCDHCHAAVARTDRGLETIGKVADLVPTGARLTLGLEGTYQNTRLQLIGRVQMQWQQGVWDEWYASFADGRFAWIAEAQGRYTITFKQPAGAVPPFAALKPQQTVAIAKLGRFVVSDLKQARYLTAAGELPESIPLDGTPVASADLSGRDGGFATIDYADDEPQIYAGNEVALEALHFASGATLGPPSEKRISAAKLDCPHCGGSLELRAPDHTRRVVCPYCNSLLDVDNGALAFLKTLTKSQSALELGSRVHFFERDYVLIGWMRRKCTIEGVDYFWQEYLLYDEATAGFRFLVDSAGHWSFVEPVATGDVDAGFKGAAVHGRFFKVFSRTRAVVTEVLGEFYWAVEVGETVDVCDYVAPPYGLSSELSGQEINWSQATYLEPREVAAACKLKKPLPAAAGVGMMQPNPYVARSAAIKRWALICCAIAIGMFIVCSAIEHDVVFSGPLQPDLPGVLAAAEKKDTTNEPMIDHTPTAEQPWQGAIAFSTPFHLQRGRNVAIEMRSEVSNSWSIAGGELIRTDSDEVRPFYLETSYYFGVDDGESWSEGSQEATAYIGDIQTGEYVLRAELGWEPDKPRPEMKFTVTSGVPRMVHLLTTLTFLLVPLVFIWMRRNSFEKKRWEESDVEQSSSEVEQSSSDASDED